VGDLEKEMSAEDKAFLESGVTVENTFVRHRNVLLSEADFSPLYVDYYLHCKDQGIHHEPEFDQLFKELLAAFTLHCASRPQNEVIAWTIRFANPLCSAFFAGDTERGTVAGRLFTSGIRPGGESEMYQEIKRPNKPLHRSYVDFKGQGAIAPVERFYAQSEQRPGRLFFPEGDVGVLATAHPDYDEGWFTTMSTDILAGLSENEESNLLETRRYRWFCGCSLEKIQEVLRPICEQDPEQIFGNDPTATVNCPRCAAHYTVTKDDLNSL
jgi:molecular chaperone Hsp33|tara:strand:+ start:1991 stop:2797 length:807 start_codon:yes stop_codon:yes gene_type:complete